MSLSVSSFPGAHSTNQKWGEAPSPTTKRWFFGGVSFMKGIRHIGKMQLKNSVARLAPKSSFQSLRPTPTPPPRLSVRTSAIVIDLIAVPHKDGPQTSADRSRDASIPDHPTSSLKWRASPLLEGDSRPRAIFTGARAAASGKVQQQQPRTRVNSEAARTARGGSISPSPSWKLNTKEMGPVPDLPVVVLTPADSVDLGGSPSVVTHESKNELPNGDSNLQQREAKVPFLRRSLSTPHLSSNRIKELPPLPVPLPPSPSPLPLLDAHIARLRSGSRPTPIPPSPLLATVVRSKTSPTAHVTPTAQPMLPYRLRGPRSTRDRNGSANGSCSQCHLPRSRSQPLLRSATTATGATKTGAAAPISRSSSRGPALTLAEDKGTPVPADHLTASPGRSIAEMPEVLQKALSVRASPQGGEGAHSERRPRTAPDTGCAARPLPPVDRRAAWETRGMGAGGARQRATRLRLPYGPR